MVVNIFIIVLIILAGTANGIMDLIYFHWNKAPKFMQTFDDFWNPAISWKNKWYKKRSTKQYNFLKERFWGSSRWFVFMTDGWHMCKEIMISSICLALALNFDFTILVFITFRLGWYVGFKIFYK